MTKKKALVLCHLEDVSWRVLGEYRDIVEQMIRRRAGIYALYRKDRLYYVGQARNLMGRVNDHLKDRHHGSWDRFSVFLTVDDEHMKDLESMILRIANPSGNDKGGTFAKSINLLDTLHKGMKEHDADRRARLLGGLIAERRRHAKTRRGKGTIRLAGVVERRISLVAYYSGKKYRASLRKNGKIFCKNKAYDSPSAAAHAITGTAQNGWSFWQYRNRKREWVPLSELRG